MGALDADENAAPARSNDYARATATATNDAGCADEIERSARRIRPDADEIARTR